MLILKVVSIGLKSEKVASKETGMLRRRCEHDGGRFMG